MDDHSHETLEKIRQQFDRTPYPRIPLERSPKQDYNALFSHSLVTPYYLRYQQVIDPAGKLILDAGCGSGYTSLTLAEANPGAHIIGIDLSAPSIELAQQRLQHHGFENVEFHVLSVDDLPQLGLTFDYINCDELLYILPDPAAGLQVMRSVLQPHGILRANLHNAYQRAGFFRSQALFKMLGLMEDTPDEFAAEVVIETMQSLKDSVMLKAQSWNPLYEKPEREEGLMMNMLLVGDKGYTISDLFAMLRAADLEFVSMVNWRHWEVTDLFKDADNLPAFWGMSLMGASVEERLRLYELLNPVHRLMDFWCAKPDETITKVPVEASDDSDWQRANVYLHPHLQTDQVKQALIACVMDARPFEISKFINLPVLGTVLLDSTRAACLLPLWDSPQPLMHLVEHYRKLRSVNPVTLEPVTPETAFHEIKEFFNRLDAFLYVLIEKSA